MAMPTDSLQMALVRLRESEREQRQSHWRGKNKKEDDERLAQIECDIREKTFDTLSPQGTCRRARNISHSQWIEELKTRIKDYLANSTNANIADCWDYDGHG